MAVRLWYSAGGAYPTANAVMAAMAAGRMPPPNVSRAELGLFEAPRCARERAFACQSPVHVLVRARVLVLVC